MQHVFFMPLNIGLRVVPVVMHIMPNCEKLLCAQKYPCTIYTHQASSLQSLIMKRGCDVVETESGV